MRPHQKIKWLYQVMIALRDIVDAFFKKVILILTEKLTHLK